MEFFGWVSAILFSICYLPQIYRTHKLQEVDDISIWLFIFNAAAYIAGTFYAVYLDKLPLMFNYLAGLSLTTIIICQWWLYRDPNKDKVRRIVENQIKQLKKDLKRRDK